MTTIAYKDGVIAYDSRITRDTEILYDDFQKCREEKGVKFILAGKTSHYARLVAAYFGAAESRDLHCSAIIIDADGLWYAVNDGEDGFWKSPLISEKPYAIGSGGLHALTAMDMGATAAEAVEMAKKRDTCTGGLVRTINLNGAAGNGSSATSSVTAGTV